MKKKKQFGVGVIQNIIKDNLVAKTFCKNVDETWVSKCDLLKKIMIVKW